MNPVEDIKRAIDKLSPAERVHIGAWIQQGEDPGYKVAESAPAYQGGSLLSVEEYLRFEAEAELRHEYIAGEIFAMSGVSAAHSLIAGNLHRLIANHLHGGPCRAHFSDFKVRLKSNLDDVFYYPDLVVACGRPGMQDYYVNDPKMIVEVLSPSTEGIDRREKLINYLRIASLEEYILVAQDKSEVTLYRRGGRRRPLVHSDVNSTVEIQSLELTVTLAEIYDGVPSAPGSDGR
jgi:Uma2 family endonuclease